MKNMLISRTPFRISFLGGGTDYKSYFSKYGGSVISTTIDKYSYITLKHLPAFFSYKNQLVYSKIELFDSPEELEHPAVREALKWMSVDNVYISYHADLPARAGLGASSSFSVGLLNALQKFKGERPGKMELALEAIHLEQELCKEMGGMQDQLAVAFGGFNRINFSASGYEIIPIDITVVRNEELQNNLMLFFTGTTHLSTEIAEDQQKNIPDRLEQLHAMKALVDEGEKVLTGSEPLYRFGELLHESWMFKRTLSKKISTSLVENIYDRALEAGAVGGKLLGAGGGGFMLFYVEKENRKQVKQALSDLLYVPFKFETEGTKMFYVEESSDE